MPKKKVRDELTDTVGATRPDRDREVEGVSGQAGHVPEPETNPYAWYYNDIIPETADPGVNQYVNATPEPDILSRMDELSPDDREAISTAEPVENPYLNYISLTDLYPDNGGNGDGGYQLPEYNPTQYSSAWNERMNAIINDLDLDKFKFDLNGEELYQQYKDQYLRNGRLAMMDTMGQAAGLTGGYGSSYAQQVGQQTYQGYVNELNNVVPDVYNAAYTRWRDSISDKLRQYELMADAENRDYNRWYNDEKMRYDAYSDAQSLASKERIAQMEADQKAAENERKRQDSLWETAYKNGDAGIVNGERVFYNNGASVNPDGTVVKAGGADIHGLSEKDIADSIEKSLDNLYSQGGILGVYGTQMANMAQTNPQSVARMLAQKIGQENGWDPTQISYATSYILALLKEEE